MSKVLITGGAGFIGSHLAQNFVQQGHTVHVLDNLDMYYETSIKRRNVEICREAAETFDGTYKYFIKDLTRPGTYEDLDDDYDYIYHEAAQAGVRISVKDPFKPNEVNVDGTLKVLEFAKRIDAKRVINASSSSVYGKAEYLTFDEEHPTNPVSPYGVSKLAAEHYTRVYNDVYGLPTVSLRYFTVYGPRMRPGMAISNFVARCLNGEPPEIYGDGSKTRDFTHINDIVEANLALMDTDAADGEVLNIGSGGNISIEELAHLVTRLTDPSLEPIYTDPVKGDAEATHSDWTKAHDLIDYTPSIDIEEGVEMYVDWLKENPDWYRETIPA